MSPFVQACAGPGVDGQCTSDSPLLRLVYRTLMAHRKLLVLLLFLLLDAAGPGPLVHTASAAVCGHERWSVKTGTDPDAGLVALGAVTPTTVQTMGSLPRPTSLPLNNRVEPVETTVWVTDATLTIYKEEENDSDYHVVL